MNRTIICLLHALLLTIPGALPAQEHWTYLDNGHIRLGVNMDAGGCIGWFSHSRSLENVLNTFDHGRYVQQSYYGDKDGSDWNGRPWRYNPVQGGSWKGEPATILDKSESKNAIYIKTRPRQWASGKDVEDMVMEQRFTIDGGLAVLKYRMTYTGKTGHKATHQELPAVFVRPRYDTLVFCEQGQKAWASAPLTRKQPGKDNEIVRFSEPWAAWVDANGTGVGVYFPHADFATTYRVRDTGIGDCSYIAPLQTFALKPSMVFDYQVVLALGTAGQIRAAIAKFHEQTASTQPDLDRSKPSNRIVP